MIAGAVLALLLGTGEVTAASSAGGDYCSVGLRSDPDPIALPDFDLLHADPDKPLRAMPRDLFLVTCARRTVVPGPADFRVLLDWHVPLILVAGSRTLMVEIVDGRLQVRFLEGQLDPAEQAALQHWVEDTQPRFYRPKPSAP